MIQLKVCGITQLADARFAAGAMVDYLGFIFYSGSPRYITPAKAKEIIGWISGPQTVGVFVSQHADEINTTAAFTGVDMVQVHGACTPNEARFIEKPLIRAISVKKDATAEELCREAEKWVGTAACLLLDTHDDALVGGTGRSWDWSVLEKADLPLPFFLAGGMNSDKVRSALRILKPAGIDISSQLESSPGVKDFDKMEHFFEQWMQIQQFTSNNSIG